MDEHSGWWPDWYRFATNRITSDIIVGDLTLHRPHISPDDSKYIQWTDTGSLVDNSTLLMDPFDFGGISLTNRTRCKVHQTYWKRAVKICTNKNITPTPFSVPRFDSMRNRIRGNTSEVLNASVRKTKGDDVTVTLTLITETMRVCCSRVQMF